MRFLVLLFGLFGITLTALAGGIMIFFNDAALGINPFLKDFLQFEIPGWAYEPITGPPHANAGILLLLAAFYGFLGVVLSGIMRCGWQGALLLILPVILTSLMNPLTAPFTSLQLFTGLLSFLVFPLPINAPTADSDEDDSEDD